MQPTRRPRACGSRGRTGSPGVVQTEGVEAEGPRAGPHLDFGVPQFVDAHGNGRLDRRQFPSFGQQGPQVFFTALARDGQFHFLAPPQGNPILEDREEFHTQEIALGGFGRAITTEPEQSLGIPGRVLHYLAIPAECEDSERGGNPEVLGQFDPTVAPSSRVSPAATRTEGTPSRSTTTIGLPPA